MFDCIAGYHLNPLTCGVAKFNAILGEKLDIPVLSVFDTVVLDQSSVLLSIKCAEFSEYDLFRLYSLVNNAPTQLNISLFLHDFSDTLTERCLIERAQVVYCGNHEIYERLTPVCKSLVRLWSPATLQSRGDYSPGELSVFTFGMAHKLRAGYYCRLKELLEATEKTYTVFISTALHEGTAFEGTFSAAFDQLQGIFGDHVRFLGFLSDDAVYQYLRHSTFFAAFFDKGVRDNNSSVNAAMQAGAVVITNLDSFSPPDFCHSGNVLDIERVRELPTGAETLKAISESARSTVASRSWESFLKEMFSAGTSVSEYHSALSRDGRR